MENIQDKNPTSNIEVIGISVHFDRIGMTFSPLSKYRGVWATDVKPDFECFDFRSIL